ncbi:MAG TPA: NADH-quinone oxidoreductase subunit M [Candidatus Paceibacterota bacterium]|nr:NADH-quinone oxidoreductase subunit M [Verrucomicrobiota bacterium]HRY50930.1 NADH-quinone oxidoreductase subunit M [Candidatus Paceibacterota bacterium]HRZ99961.1 NADH-quinone oxidoreductase subunit M [Candidatus Paceibacterota bacterium]
MSVLSYILLWPLLSALCLLCVPREQRVAIRAVAVFSTLVTALLAIKMFLQFDAGVPGFQFVQKVAWVRALDISYHVGVDGINVGLILMGAVVAFAAACVSWEIQSREKEFYVLLLVMTGGILGAFASLDLFFFYCFHELALVPTFIMIGVWGRGRERNYAAFKMTIYLSVGALLALAGLIVLYIQSGAESFNLLVLTDHLRTQPLGPRVQQLLFPVLLFGFGILVSLWPFHTWAPLGYASAPTATAMLHAGVLKKFGLYALLRIAVPLVPEGATAWMPVVAWLCLGNLVYCGLVACRQKDLHGLIGYSSVAHMGFVFLGLASLNLIGVTGAVYVMIAHGFLAALSFGLAGFLYQQTGTVEYSRLGGLLRSMPFWGTALVMAMLAGCGVPGFASFIGELLVLFGAWKPYPVITGLALWGALIVGAVYMFRAIRHMLHGPLADEFKTVQDASDWWRRLPFLTLLVFLLGFGCFPRMLTVKIEPSVQAVLSQLKTVKPAVAETRGPAGGQNPDSPMVALGEIRNPMDPGPQANLEAN